VDGSPSTPRRVKDSAGTGLGAPLTPPSTKRRRGDLPRAAGAGGDEDGWPFDAGFDIDSVPPAPCATLPALAPPARPEKTSSSRVTTTSTPPRHSSSPKKVVDHEATLLDARRGSLTSKHEAESGRSTLERASSLAERVRFFHFRWYKARS
jgi:hypothetical protein